jgi:hypothetical protein
MLLKRLSLVLLILVSVLVGCKSNESDIVEVLEDIETTNKLEVIIDGLESDLKEVKYERDALQSELSMTTSRLEESQVDYNNLLEECEEVNCEYEEKITELEVTIVDYKTNIIGLEEQKRELEFQVLSIDALTYFDDDNNESEFIIHSPYSRENGWYILVGEDFSLELTGYEEAFKVEFWTIQLQTNFNNWLIIEDRDSSDGWGIEVEDIGDMIPMHENNYVPLTVIYADIYFADDEMIRTETLPVYRVDD